MEIIINSDSNITVTEVFTQRTSESLNKRFKHYLAHITRMEMFLSDTNSSKSGDMDKKCVLEARIKGQKPHAATAMDGNLEIAIISAMDKMENILRTEIGKLKEHS